VRSQEGETKKRIPYWRTALYDACFAAFGKLATGAHPKRILFIITDGSEDNASTHKFSELQNLIRSSDVLIYAVCLTTFSSPAAWQQEKIHELTALSGGWSYFPSKGKEVEEVVDHMALELRRQYVVGFTPTNAAQSGKWNKVKIKITPRVKIKNPFVRSREGYFSPVITPAP
jgi:Ca-activated chloride channel family protein